MFVSEGHTGGDCGGSSSGSFVASYKYKWPDNRRRKQTDDINGDVRPARVVAASIQYIFRADRHPSPCLFLIPASIPVHCR